MLSLYIAALIFGGGLLALSLFGGHGHADADGDGHIDLHADADAGDHDQQSGAHHAAGHAEHPDAHVKGGGDFVAIFVSLRFWTFLLGFGGLTGLLLTLLSVPAVATAAVAGGVGTLFGFIAAWAVRSLSRNQFSSSFSSVDWQGRSAYVTVPVSAARAGKIRLELEDEVKEVLAVANADDGELAVGTEVIIASINNGVALVTPNKPDALARSRAAARPNTH